MEEEKFKCGICKKDMPIDSLGYPEAKEGNICTGCYQDKLREKIKDLEGFISSEKFNKRHELIKKKFELSEEFGNWHDITKPLGYGGIEVKSQESISDYEAETKEGIQILLLGEFISLIEELGMDKNVMEWKDKNLKRGYYLNLQKSIIENQKE